MKQYTQEIKNGISASIFLLVLYIIVMGIASKSITTTISQFQQLWYWMMTLIIGFGIQVGLYTHLRNVINEYHSHAESRIMTASRGTSSVSMIACCAHHLTEVLPILGLSGAALFLSRYQIPLIILGIAMNGFGIIFMLRIIKKIS